MANFARGPQTRAAQLPANAPHAALLIDFDNVTMGIRSDLTKELKSLLNSDIIKGKVAVQRAYADWRRYPQYIVSLAENSVDLIFAPAYGTSKKNATDIRLAIDALELVFTRPEIGTFILLSGDSDFSSLVLKLKEYGKYVIGVGIRESSSDLLVQNCDEYYSYSGLTGLTRAGMETTSEQFDPWELVELAVRQMADHNDVMRSDRLKQIMLELDPNFDEKSLGFPKFNRFVQEAASKGLLQLRKMENGQFEVSPVDPLAAAAEPVAVQEERPRRGRDRGAAAPPARERPSGRAAEQREATPAEPAEPAEPPSRPAAQPRSAEAQAEARAEAPPEAPAEPAAPPSRAAAQPLSAEPPALTGEIESAYQLLQRATSDLLRGRTTPLRDSDVKRRMLELQPGFDESVYGFSKFSRFLRQAHDAEVINLNKVDNGSYEVTLGDKASFYRPRDTEAGEPRAERGDRKRGRDRDRDRDRGRKREREERAPRAERPAEEETPREPKPRDEKRRDERKLEVAAAPAPTVSENGGREEQAATTPPARPAAASAATPAAPAAPAGTPATGLALGFRRGSSRRGAAPAGPPPILAGQTVQLGGAAAQPAPGPQPEQRAAKQPAAEPPTVAAGEARAATAGELAALNLPTETEAIVERLAGYKGVGRKSAEAMVQAFGAEHVFRVLHEQPERVRQMLSGRRSELLLKGWQHDFSSAAGAAKRAGRKSKSAAAEPKASKPAKGEQIEAFTASSGRKRAGTRRGGRKKTTSKQ